MMLATIDRNVAYLILISRTILAAPPSSTTSVMWRQIIRDFSWFYIWNCSWDEKNRKPLHLAFGLFLSLSLYHCVQWPKGVDNQTFGSLLYSISILNTSYNIIMAKFMWCISPMTQCKINLTFQSYQFMYGPHLVIIKLILWCWQHSKGMEDIWFWLCDVFSYTGCF